MKPEPMISNPPCVTKPTPTTAGQTFSSAELKSSGVAIPPQAFGPFSSAEAIISAATKRVKSLMSWRMEAFSKALM